MKGIEYRDAKISDVAADMLANSQDPKSYNDLIGALDYAIHEIIMGISPNEDWYGVVKEAQNLCWLRNFMKELLKPDEQTTTD